jgi:tetratricopeptide (TPR) repeat protein
MAFTHTHEFLTITFLSRAAAIGRPLSSKLKPKDRVHASQAMQALRSGNLRTAIDCFQKIGKRLESDPGLARAAGFAHLKLGEFDQALGYLTASLRGAANQPDVHAAIGDILVRGPDVERALAHLRRAVDLAPKVPDLRYKFGLALLGAERWDEAGEQMGMALELDPGHVKSRIGLARALMEINRLAEAETELEQARVLEPQNYAVTFRLGVLREKQRRVDQAIACYVEAEAKSNHAAPVCQALGLAYLSTGDTDNALAAFRRGLERSPFDLNLLKFVAELRYEMADVDPLSDYRGSLGVAPRREVLAGYVGRLTLAGQIEEAASQLGLYERQFGKDPEWIRLWAAILDDRGDYARLIGLLERVPRGNRELMTWKARALIGIGDAQSAQDILMPLIHDSPGDQYLLALLTTCYRLSGKPEYQELVDYEKLVIQTRMACPPGFDSLESFNHALREVLQIMHVTRHNPMSQSVLGGTQTPGNLLRSPDPVIVALKQAVDTTLAREFSAGFFDCLDSRHPVSVGRGRHIEPSAAWSVWVTQGGYHRSHVHTRGWYSSAYYVSLPETVRNRGRDTMEGALAFGKPGVGTPEGLEADEIVFPEEGMLALFPSYFWHGTLPFNGPEPRVVVAFDSLPSR